MSTRARGSRVAVVCPPSHKHAAMSTCYTDHGCRCTPCRAENRARAARRRRDVAYGRWQPALVLPGHTAAHIQVLVRFGYSHPVIAERAGVNPRTVWRVANLVDPHIHRRVQDSILAIQPSLDDLPLHALIDARGVRRRVQALGCLGWSIAALAAELGMPRRTLSVAVHGRRVTVRVHRQVAVLFDRLWATRPVARDSVDARMIARTAAHARKAGWVFPLGWDDIDADADDASPALDDADDAPASDDADVLDEIAVDLAVQGVRVRLTRQERLLALTRLHPEGHDDSKLSRLLGVCPETVRRDREQLDLPPNYFRPGHVRRPVAA